MLTFYTYHRFSNIAPPENYARFTNLAKWPGNLCTGEPGFPVTDLCIHERFIKILYYWSMPIYDQIYYRHDAVNYKPQKGLQGNSLP